MKTEIRPLLITHPTENIKSINLVFYLINKTNLHTNIL